MKYFTEINDLPKLSLDVELQTLFDKEILAGWPHHSQICVNSIAGHTANWHFGAASLEYDWNKEIVLSNGNKQVPKREISLQENDFTELCDVFVGTLFEELYHCLQKKYKIGRVRLMKLNPQKCMTWHKDNTKRLHYPIKTQDGCFMVIDNEILHLKKQQWYLTDTAVKHTAFNGSHEHRIHLVATIL